MFGLYFLAANVDADVTVLDFPSKKRFVRELARGYDIVGISSRLATPGSPVAGAGHDTILVTRVPK